MTAGTLYEAVALGLKTLHHTECVDDLPEGEIQVAVQNVPVSHTVKFVECNAPPRESAPSSRSRTHRLQVLPARFARRSGVRRVTHANFSRCGGV